MSNNDYSMLIDEIVDKINKAINIPLLSESQEAIIIKCILQVLLQFLEKLKIQK